MRVCTLCRFLSGCPIPDTHPPLNKTHNTQPPQVCTMTGSNLFSLLMTRSMLPLVPVLVHAIATLANLTAFTMIKQARLSLFIDVCICACIFIYL